MKMLCYRSLNTTKQKALLQGVISHASFLVLFPDSSLTSLSLGKTPSFWAHGRDKSPYSVYWLSTNPAFNFTSPCCYTSFLASLSSGPLLGFIGEIGSFTGCTIHHVQPDAGYLSTASRDVSKSPVCWRPPLCSLCCRRFMTLVIILRVWWGTGSKLRWSDYSTYFGLLWVCFK